MKRAFTLIELLVAVGLAAMLGTISVGGYYAASRGMAERGAIQDVTSFIRMAQQHAIIDNVPVAVFFCNQLVQKETDDQPQVVAGTAVAVRYASRISRTGLSGYLVDEFADWEKSYSSGTSSSGPGMRFYSMAKSDVSAGLQSSCSLVRSQYEKVQFTDYLPWLNTETNLVAIAFKIESGKSDWKVGDPYGFEIGTFQLPHNFIFGSSVPSQDFTSHDVQQLYFDPSKLNSSSYTFNFETVRISAMRPSSGGMRAEQIGTVKQGDL